MIGSSVEISASDLHNLGNQYLYYDSDVIKKCYSYTSVFKQFANVGQLANISRGLTTYNYRELQGIITLLLVLLLLYNGTLITHKIAISGNEGHLHGR